MSLPALKCSTCHADMEPDDWVWTKTCRKHVYHKSCVPNCNECEFIRESLKESECVAGCGSIHSPSECLITSYEKLRPCWNSPQRTRDLFALAVPDCVYLQSEEHIIYHVLLWHFCSWLMKEHTLFRNKMSSLLDPIVKISVLDLTSRIGDVWVLPKNQVERERTIWSHIRLFERPREDVEREMPRYKEYEPYIKSHPMIYHNKAADTLVGTLTSTHGEQEVYSLIEKASPVSGYPACNLFWEHGREVKALVKKNLIRIVYKPGGLEQRIYPLFPKDEETKKRWLRHGRR